MDIDIAADVIAGNPRHPFWADMEKLAGFKPGEPDSITVAKSIVHHSIMENYRGYTVGPDETIDDVIRQRETYAETLAAAMDEIRKQDGLLSLHQTTKHAQAKVIRALMCWEIEGPTLCAWCFAVGAIVGVAIGGW